MKYFLSAAACALSALFLSTSTAAAITFDLTGSSTKQSFFTFLQDGITLTVTPAGFNDLSNAIYPLPDGSQVTRNGNGMGIDNAGIRDWFDPAQINGPFELLMLTFSEKVVFDSLYFGDVDAVDDFDLAVDGNFVLEDVNIASQNPFNFVAGMTGTTLGIGADALLGFLGLNDTFRVMSVSVSKLEVEEPPVSAPVSEVPLPAALPLMGTGLAALFLAGRRRKRAAA